MLAKITLDPNEIRQAELSAERKWGPGWRTKKLEMFFAELLVTGEPVVVTPKTFEWWHVLLTTPNREQHSAKWLERAKLPIYLPLFTKRTHCRGKLTTPRLTAVMPGLLFVPREFMEVEHRDELLEWAGVRGHIRTSDGGPALVPEREIDCIRNIEAKLNLPPEAKGVLFKVGENVRFKEDLYAGWGDAIIFEIASETRIGVEVKKLFGRATRVYVPASEIEAM